MTWSFTDPVNAVNSEDVDDVEVGAVIYSRTRFDGQYPLGGVVINCDVDDEGHVFHFLYFRNGAPVRDRMRGDDVDTGTMSFKSMDAAGAAKNVRRWHDRHGRNLSRQDNFTWDDIVLNLTKATLAGTFTPGAQERYDAALERPNEAAS